MSKSELGDIASSKSVLLQPSAIIGLAASTACLCILGWFVAQGDFRSVGDGLRQIGPLRLFWAGFFSVCSYLVLTLYDLTALRTIGRQVSIGVSMRASFVNYALIHNLGFPLLTGSFARFRFYSAQGLTAWEISKIIGFDIVTFWLGVTMLMALVLIAGGGTRLLAALPGHLDRSIGWLILTAISLYVVACFRSGGRELRLGRFVLGLPTGRVCLAQFAIASVDMACAATAFFVLVPTVSFADYPLFLASYVLAMGSALLSNAPGGIGVFEGVMLLSFSEVEPATLLPALIAYRAIYYLIPLAIAAIVWLQFEFTRSPKSIASGQGKKRKSLLTDKFEQIVAQSLLIEQSLVTDDLAYNSIKEWDSVAHMVLVAALEDGYDVMFDTDEIIAMSSIGTIKQILKTYDVDA